MSAFTMSGSESGISFFRRLVNSAGLWTLEKVESPIWSVQAMELKLFNKLKVFSACAYVGSFNLVVKDTAREMREVCGGG